MTREAKTGNRPRFIPRMANKAHLESYSLGCLTIDAMFSSSQIQTGIQVRGVPRTMTFLGHHIRPIGHLTAAAQAGDHG